MANRIKIRARNVKKPFDIVSKEGMLKRGVIYLEKPGVGYRRKLEHLSLDKRKHIIHTLKDIRSSMIRHYSLPSDYLLVDEKMLRLITSPAIVLELSDELKDRALIPAIVEEYPTWDQTEMSVEFL
jgi:pyruvate formate-lyase activating enzyme-like uncharacterized protein